MHSSECCHYVVYWWFYVTVTDISAIYVTAHKCSGGLKKEVELRTGSQNHEYFAGDFD